MSLKVFCDFHHASLLQSFILLFEGRLGGKVYRPIGMEWAERGYWKVYDHPATQAQFLGIGAATPDGSEPLNEVISSATYIGKSNPDFFHCHDIDSDQFNRAITFEGFMRTDFDIVIASIPAHVEPFKRLCAEHPNHPKLIFQIGNSWTNEAAMAPNVMASAKIDSVPAGIHLIEYHQEFDTRIFNPGYYEFMDRHTIYSFVNCFNTEMHLRDDFELFRHMAGVMTNWSFKAYGGQCPDGAIGPSQALADKMREAMFIWHTKRGGDGYGHIIHNAAAVGRPIIVKKEYYKGKLAESLLKDGETCLAIDGLDGAGILQKIEFYSEPGRYAAMCQATVDNFRRVCDFDAEFLKIKDFLANLQ